MLCFLLFYRGFQNHVDSWLCVLVCAGQNDQSESTKEARQELKGAYADASFWKRIESKEVQETSPWYSKRLKQLQSELFIEAMKVNELFILRANVTSSRIKTTLDGFFSFLKTGGDLTEKEIQAMWNTFWLIVPVVSSTFASIQRMFSQMRTGTIPWLFVDEAGQAVPQAAAGAIGVPNGLLS